MKIALIEPFYSGSHKRWCDGLMSHSRHDFQLFSLPGRHWKWRMHGAAITLSELYSRSDEDFDLIIASDFLDVALFAGLIPDQKPPILLYFHENQLTYPWSPDDPDTELNRDNHYAFINYSSALVADMVLFNSAYHKDSFLSTLPSFLSQFPDYQNLESVEDIRSRSSVLPLGLDYTDLDRAMQLPLNKDDIPVILWNHRWEYDKNPEAFFKALFRLQSKGVEFKLVVVGEQFNRSPKIFESAKARLKQHIVHWGYVEDRAAYAALLNYCDILPVTSMQDFFGISVVEAMYCGVWPILPDRLVYPEHLIGNRERHLYADDSELDQKLMYCVQNLTTIRDRSDRQMTPSYAWPIIIERYDGLFDKVLSEVKI